MVWRVDRPIYGLAQAGRRWQRTLFDWFKAWGLKQCQHDTCVFVRNSSVDTSNGPREDTLIVGCYIDDLYIVYNSSDAASLYTKFVLDLQSRWSVEDEGDVSDLLNVEITRVDGGVELRQTNYINKLLATWLPEGVPPRVQINSTPHTDELPSLALEAITAKDECSPELKSRYQSLVGSLLNASVCIRPDITYPVGILCRAMGSRPPAYFSMRHYGCLPILDATRQLACATNRMIPLSRAWLTVAGRYATARQDTPFK